MSGRGEAVVVEIRHGRVRGKRSAGATSFKGILHARAFTGDSPPRALAEEMRAAWVAFASGRDPGWPAWEEQTRAEIVFAERSHVTEDPEAARRVAWEGHR